MHRIVAFALLLLPVACGGGNGPRRIAANLLAAPHVGDELLLTLTEPDDPAEVDEVLNDLQGLAIERIGQTSVFVLMLPPATDLQQVLDDLEGDLRVVVSTPNYLAESPEGGPGTVPTFGSDLLANIADQGALTGAGLPAAHQVTRGAGVVVAVVDTGVDFSHAFLQGSLHPGGFDFIGQDADPSEERNFLDDDGDGRVDEQYGHGTYVASLVHAVAPDAMILPVRALDDEGFGTASAVSAAVAYAVDMGVQVINVSVDIPNSPEAVQEAIDYAQERGVVVVAAAGNEGLSGVVFPARYREVIGVTAVGPGDVAPAFANHGSQVDLVAPGVDLIGAVPLSLNPLGTARWSGTSFAAPLVAGGAALVLAR
ncbi:MAG: S8 family serine peptidase, partial [Planctomycetota bacterium]